MSGKSDGRGLAARIKAIGLVPRIMILSLAGVVLLGVTVAAVAAYLLHEGAARTAQERVDTNIRVAWEVLRAQGAPFRVEGGKLLAGSHVLNDSADVVDRVKQLVGGTCTVFMGDLRVATNVLKPDGSRAVGTRLAKSPAYEAVLERRTSFRGEVAILGEPYMTAYDPITDDKGNVIGILYVGIGKKDFLKAVDQTILGVIAATLVVMIAVGGASFLVVRRSVVRPLRESVAVMDELAQGNLDAKPLALEHGGEIGEMARALEVFRAGALERRRLEAHEKAEQAARDRRQAAMEQLTRDFNEGVHGVLQAVTASAAELRDAAREMTSVAEATSAQSTTVAASAEQAAGNVETVATAAEELAAAESEISRQIARSSEIAREAMAEAERVNAIVASLSETTEQIGNVVGLINDVAAQTNLLSLNATIEAARAGEAGRGFGVVANEVKNLAAQTAQATGEIERQIKSVQAVTREAVDAIGGIGRTIIEINENAGAIAAAVEEQSAATHEIARNVQEASVGTQSVTASIAQVKDGATTGGVAARQVFATAESLSKQSHELAGEVADFLSAIRTAGERRQYERIACNLPVQVMVVGGRSQPSKLVDVSLGGGRIAIRLREPAGTAVQLEIAGWPVLRGRIAGHLDSGTRLQFALDEATRKDIEARLERLAAAA